MKRLQAAGGYQLISEASVAACLDAGVEPLLAMDGMPPS